MSRRTSSEAEGSGDTEEARGFSGRPHGGRATSQGQHLRIDDALQRALVHPKYRMTGKHGHCLPPALIRLSLCFEGKT